MGIVWGWKEKFAGANKMGLCVSSRKEYTFNFWCFFFFVSFVLLGPFLSFSDTQWPARRSGGVCPPSAYSCCRLSSSSSLWCFFK